MADVVITNTIPLTLNIIFTDLEVKAMQWDATQQAEPITDFDAFVLERAAQYIDATVRRYNDYVTNTLVEKYNAATPEQQQAALDALG